MPATVVINRLTGVGPTETAIQGSSTRASLSDNPTPGTANAIPVPDAGTNASWWVTTQLKVTGGSFTQVDTIKWYSDGTEFGTGVTCIVGTVGSGLYTQAATGGTNTGLALNGTNYTGFTSSGLHTIYTSGSPLNVSGTLTAVGHGSNLVVYQIVVGTGASAGATNSPTFTWQYDEI